MERLLSKGRLSRDDAQQLLDLLPGAGRQATSLNQLFSTYSTVANNLTFPGLINLQHVQDGLAGAIVDFAGGPTKALIQHSSRACQAHA